jgi:CheY-like chemotaxis protein
MSSSPEHPTTSVLLIDGNANDRAFYAEGLRRCACDYEIIEATDRQSGRALYQSRPIDCVVLELALPDDSGFQILVDLVPRLSRPHVPVIILTQFTHRGVWEAAKQNGAYGCLAKTFSSGEDLDNAIQRAVAFVGQTPREDRCWPILRRQR